MTQTLEVPGAKSKVLMHSCCAPCSVAIIEQIVSAGIELTVFFYNPNIHPQQEYELRKNEIMGFSQKIGIPFIDADYDVQNWFTATAGLEHEPERGRRCVVCFEMRLKRTAHYAYQNGFPIITSSLGISRWKDIEAVNYAGVKAASDYDGVTYWTYNWRKNGGTTKMYESTKRENFYKQLYCGCIYSLLDSTH